LNAITDEQRFEMSWKILDIRAERLDRVKSDLASASHEQLLERIADLEASLYPFVVTLGSLDDKLDWPYASMGVCSKFFPLRAESGKMLVFNRETNKSDEVDDPPPERLHEVEYYTDESVSFDKGQGGKLHDSFKVIEVRQSATAASIYCGAVFMEDVRRAQAVLSGEALCSPVSGDGTKGTT
jgi:hypothetical protein